MKQVSPEVRNYVLDDFAWQLDVPAFLKEAKEGGKNAPYAVIFNILLNLLAILAKRASELNDPALNIIMLRLALYEGSHSNNIGAIVKRLQEEIRAADVEEKSLKITGEILEANGWEWKGGLYYYTETTEHGKVRIGWRNGEFILGYALFPREIWLVHELNQIMRLAGLSNQIK